MVKRVVLFTSFHNHSTSFFLSLSPSQLHCVHFSSWDNNKDWSTSLPSKESITAIAVGDGWIATATSKQQIRLFTISGVQREIISIPGTQCISV